MNIIDSIGKELSNPFSTGGGGPHFEAHVQASFVVLMLADGFVPCLPTLPIKKIKFQGKIDGYGTDDLIVFMERPDGNQQQKLLGQIKHSVSFTASDPILSEVIHSAWRDFNNRNLFTRRQDAIAIVTGPLSATDIEVTRWILEWARSCESSEEFIRNVETANFSSDNKRAKLAAFRRQLAKANLGNELSNDQLFEFLRHFHILSYDLDVKSGVVLSLLHSLMNQYSMDNVRAIWTQVVDEVQNANKNAGTLTKENLPMDLVSAFQRQKYSTIPETYAPTEPQKLDLNQLPQASAIALANLIGGWNDNREADAAAISKLVDEKFSRWILKLQEMLQIEDSPIKFREGQWHVSQRLHVWQSLGQRIFDKSVEAFKACIVSVLAERDPKFELLPKQRFGAAFQEKTFLHSPALRRGLAETLALMGTHPKALANCSDGKVRSAPILSVREIFQEADWVTWGSLNDLLPLLAEAAPEEFLSVVERELGKDPCPFDQLFEQECDGVTGENYMRGLIWALESIAWSEQHLVQACILLSELSMRDPGGNSGNRPFNSLVSILLPWLPQTDASADKRKVAIETIVKEQPNIAWKMLLSLLPRPQQLSTRSYSPTFKSTGANVERFVSREEYRQQVNHYVDLALGLATGHVEKLVEIAEVLDRLPFEKISLFADKLTSINLQSEPPGDTVKLWKNLKRFIARQHRLAKEKSTDVPIVIADLEEIAKSIEPKNPAYHYQKLFGHNDPEFYRDPVGDWEEKRRKQEERRLVAIKEILEFGGPSAILEFVEIADAPIFVGNSLGSLADDNLDYHFLPDKLSTDDRLTSDFLMGYARARFRRNEGWIWQLHINKWTKPEIGKFFALLPFSPVIWNEVTDLLSDSDHEYWKRVNPNPYEASGDLKFAIDKLIDNGRPTLALACLNRVIQDKHPLNVSQAERAFGELVKSSESRDAADRHDVLEVLKALQEAPNADPGVIGKIEWQYLQLLDRELGLAPKMLEHQLASNPSFFCDVIKVLYRSKHEPKDSRTEPSAQEQSLAKNAWTLLHDWQIPPGIGVDGVFDSNHFTKWLERTQTLCTESGHLSVAMIHVGSVLFYGPPDPDGLWIHRTIAEALNKKDSEKLRVGFSQQIFNSRGVHWVDPSGQPEIELAQQYRDKAEIIENAGFQRLAASLRAIAESYVRDAEKVIAEHETDDGVW